MKQRWAVHECSLVEPKEDNNLMRKRQRHLQHPSRLSTAVPARNRIILSSGRDKRIAFDQQKLRKMCTSERHCHSTTPCFACTRS